ncbi:response regulator transcription factor [Rhodococcus sp. 24CO]|uniref:response regulator transcription factor n=1 Tax=Rhodococcus sp. 24CO TaxID=3117460 RepID=UPI003D353841
MHVGEYDRAADVTVRLIELSRYITESDRHDISDRLSTMRAQWAISFQLNGRFAESTGLARMAYWSGIDLLLALGEGNKAASTRSSALAEFTKVVTPESFPKSVHIVVRTGGEQRVLALLALGMTSVAMSRQLHVSANTIKSQLRSLYKKLDAHNRDEAIAQAHALQFI